MNEVVIYWIFENLDVQNYKFKEIPFVNVVALAISGYFLNIKILLYYWNEFSIKILSL